MGFEARHIMARTSHKSESSIKSYSRKISNKKRREISDLLAENMSVEEPQPKVTRQSTNTTESVKTNNDNVVKAPVLSTSNATVSVPTDDPNVVNVLVPIANVNLQIVQIAESNVTDDYDIPDNQILDILSDIEKENMQLVQHTTKDSTNTVADP